MTSAEFIKDLLRTDEAREVLRELVREEVAAQSQGVTAAPLPETFSEEEFCKHVGISRDTAKRLRDRGKLKFAQVGRRVLYTSGHVQEFLEANERKRKRR